MMDDDKLQSFVRGPMITAAELENCVAGPKETFNRQLSDESARFRSRIEHSVEQMLEEAYLSGVRDGFSQGAQAQARLSEGATGGE